MENFREWLPAILAGIGLTAWAVRIEAKAQANERDIRGLWNQRKDDLDAAKESRADTSKRLDSVDKALAVIQDDIKTLLRGMK